MTTFTLPDTKADIEDIEDAFTNGDCAHLAVALAKKYEDLEVNVIGTEDGLWVHAVVYHLPSGQFLDVTGVYDAQDLMMRWEWTGDHFDGIYHHDDVQGWNDEYDPAYRVFCTDINDGILVVKAYADMAGIELTERR